MIEKKCLDCQAEIQGRRDKKFCNDLCRNNYYNKMNSDASAYVKSVSRILKKNRRILIELNPTGKSNVKKAKMLSNGFNFNYFTNIYKTKTGNTYYFCYEKGYLMLNEDFCALVNRQNYVD